jgi:class 3 adenylate cyclase
LPDRASYRDTRTGAAEGSRALLEVRDRKPARQEVLRRLNSSIRVAEPPGAENLEGERKTVTALFADLKGSTELEQNLDSEEARALV